MNLKTALLLRFCPAVANFQRLHVNNDSAYEENLLLLIAINNSFFIHMDYFHDFHISNIFMIALIENNYNRLITFLSLSLKVLLTDNILIIIIDFLFSL